MDFLSLHPPEGKEVWARRRAAKGGATIYRTGERVDRDGTVDGMCEGFFLSTFPPELRHNRSCRR
jgi:hypothetical protein